MRARLICSVFPVGVLLRNAIICREFRVFYSVLIQVTDALIIPKDLVLTCDKIWKLVLEV